MSPKKHFGQNFLVNMGVAPKMLAAAELSKTDTVLEVGPGLGAITRELGLAAHRVVAVERDRELAKTLREEFSGSSNVEIVEEDMLKASLGKKGLNLKKGYKVVANLPFAIPAPLIRKFLEDDNPPALLVLLVQKEVAQRICARPPDMNLLAASVQFYCQPRLVSVIKKGVFWPQPKVDAAILRLTPFGKKLGVAPAAYFQVMKAGFLHPRKQLMNNLHEGLDLDKDEVGKLLAPCGISPAQRAETLSVSDW
ncbi:MAG: 16S rRNA (adenine(1518)-N(6)/adenine(1519)-N(6))-dimethyltransferase RsmA, partial [Dehalococcoidia bacterium]|nr:16S rRNA (adenine(1518)-N(6)/adenine(1519)-N(6))-dimethyltransferase RsmA [Dehalococcoidia bacterium]